MSFRSCGVLAFGLTVNEVNVLKSVCLLSGHSSRAFRHHVVPTNEKPDVFVVDATNPGALEEWLRLDPQQKQPAVMIGEETEASGRIGLRRPLLASRLLAALDRVALRLGGSAGQQPPAGTVTAPIARPAAVTAAPPAAASNAAVVKPAAATDGQSLIKAATPPARIGGPATRMRRQAEGPRTASGGPVTRTRRQAAQTNQFHVLVVDDSATVRKQLELALRSMNHLASCVDSGELALELLQRHTFDLVLLDVVLPGADGYEVCKQIRRASRNKNLPVIMLTSKSSPFDKIRGTLAGCDSYLVKPVDLKLFKATVGKHLAAADASVFEGANAFSVR